MKNFRKFPSLLVISLFTIAMMTSMTLQNDAFAGHGEQGFSVTATAPEGSGQIDISGYSGSESGNAVTILVVAPNGNIVHIDQLSPNDHGEFSTVVGVGSLWGQDGTYSIKIESGGASLYSANLDVDVANGVTAETNVSVDNVGVYGDDSEMTHGEDAYAPQSSSGLTISADAVEGATNIGISGSTDRTSSTVIVTVIAPNGNIVTIDQLTPGSDGTFSTDIGVGGPMWSQDGIYTVTAHQGDADLYQASVEVDVADGVVVPEFGTVASLVLVVAIASIIILSAKGRLSIAPKL
tara:strand:+ start:11798 stop:12679 length:882 start_codon:yes stop_codon:yes gene_type:complete